MCAHQGQLFLQVHGVLIRDGKGLGLAIVKHIVYAHQGEAEVESEVGKGSVCTIKLPV